MREEQARITALKERDYAQYLRLARHTKDRRLRLLLDKTDEIIRELGIKVRRVPCTFPPPCVHATSCMCSFGASGRIQRIVNLPYLSSPYSRSISWHSSPLSL